MAYPSKDYLKSIPKELDGEWAIGEPRFGETIMSMIENGENVPMLIHGNSNYVISIGSLQIQKIKDGSINLEKIPSPNKLINWDGLKPEIAVSDRGPYKMVKLDGKHFMLHQVVKNSFFINPDPEKFNTIHHIDWNPSNNALSNLIFASNRFQNHPSQKKPNPKRKNDGRPIEQHSLDGVFLKLFSSSSAAAEEVGGKGLTINVCAGKNREAYGFIWKYQKLEDLEGEEWVEVPVQLMGGQDSPYMCSSLGRVQNKHGKLLHGTDNLSGYIKVGHTHLVHVLIASVWVRPVPDPEKFKLVGHKNDCKTDNYATNLYWTDHSGNTSDAHKTGVLVSATRPILVTYPDSTTKVFESIKLTAEKLEVSDNIIRDLARGVQATSNKLPNYKIEFATESKRGK